MLKRRNTNGKEICRVCLIPLVIVGMQMKATLGGHLISVRTAFIRNTNGEECRRGCVCAHAHVHVCMCLCIWGRGHSYSVAGSGVSVNLCSLSTLEISLEVS